MKRTIAYSVALIIAGIAFALPSALAQDLGPRAPRGATVLPAYEIETIVRSTGMRPLTKPVRRGTNYLLRADDGGQEVRVVVDARLGDVISVTPIKSAGREIDPTRGASVYDSGPPIYDRHPIYRRDVPIIIEEEPEPPIYRRAPPPAAAVPPPYPEREAVVVAPAPPPLYSAPPQQVHAPPPPQQRMAPPPPQQVYAPPPPPQRMAPPPPPSAAMTPLPPIMAPTSPPTGMMTEPPVENEENMLLPPPPPRFEQRANLTPVQKPKQAKTAKPAAKTAAKTNAAKSETNKTGGVKPNTPSAAAPPTSPDAGAKPPLQLQN